MIQKSNKFSIRYPVQNQDVVAVYILTRVLSGGRYAITSVFTPMTADFEL